MEWQRSLQLAFASVTQRTAGGTKVAARQEVDNHRPHISFEIIDSIARTRLISTSGLHGAAVVIVVVVLVLHFAAVDQQPHATLKETKE